jgi:hypothetical protein
LDEKFFANCSNSGVNETPSSGEEVATVTSLLNQLAISGGERESLYREVIYTIKHKIGLTMDGHNDFKMDLYKYAQEAFKMSNADHERLFALASEEKVRLF